MRYADDILIFCRSRAGAENALAQATKILEKTLKLRVNQSKSHIAHSENGVKFLGVEIGGAIHPYSAQETGYVQTEVEADEQTQWRKATNAGH